MTSTALHYGIDSSQMTRDEIKTFVKTLTTKVAFTFHDGENVRGYTSMSDIYAHSPSSGRANMTIPYSPILFLASGWIARSNPAKVLAITPLHSILSPVHSLCWLPRPWNAEFWPGKRVFSSLSHSLSSDSQVSTTSYQEPREV